MNPGSKPIVSSAHLAQSGSPALSELEFSLTLAAASFQRWMVRCASAAGEQLSPVEVLILHTIRHRQRPKRFADIMLVLHIEDAHIVNYVVRKLEAASLVKSRREGKEKLIEVTDKGIQFCDAYREVRDQLLIETVKEANLSEESISQVASKLRALSGIYNEAARAAATL